MPSGRIEWVDTVKGIAIVAVVMYHSTLFLGDIGLDGIWWMANPLLATFRMPLFFFASGMFAGKSLSLPFTAMFRRRAWPLLWLYLLWTAVFVLLTQLLPWGWTDRDPSSVADFALSLAMPNASIWFIYALFLYSLAAWALRTLPRWAQLAPAVAVSVAVGSGLLTTGDTTWNKIATYFVFFVAARHFSSITAWFPAGWWAWPALAGYILVAALVTRLDAYDVLGLRFVLSCGAVAAGVMISRTLTNARGFGWLRWIGQRTLPIYVMHYYPIFLAAALLAPIAAQIDHLTAILAPSLCVVAVVLTLTVHHLLLRVPLLWTAPWQAKRAVPAR